jgi:hypothetical protein
LPDGQRAISNNRVGPGYFEAMGIPVKIGRLITTRDGASAPKVAVINETMARRFFLGQSPLGQRFGMGGPEHAGDIEVIGVVRDARQNGLGQDPAYLGSFVVRYSGAASAVQAGVCQAIKEADGNLAVDQSGTLEELVEGSVSGLRMTTKLSTALGVLGSFLASLGIYGLLAFAVTRRANEIGIRMALGAARGNIQSMVLREAFVLAGWGLIIGLLLAMAGNRFVSGLLFNLSPSDPVTVGGAVFLLLAVAMLAGYLPARRASRVDPMVALRCE